MSFEYLVSLTAFGLFFGMLACSEIGRRIGLASRRQDTDDAAGDKGIASAEAAVFALLGLLIAFTFSGAASRFEERRHLVTFETNAIGTAWLRLDLLPRESQPDLRALFRKYVDNRLATYRNMESDASTQASLDQGTALQAEIWTKALAAIGTPGLPTSAGMLLVPALNEMFDITTTRLAATRNHPPAVIFVMLAILALVGAMLVGYDTAASRTRQWLHIVVFAGIICLSMNVIIELEFPRAGFIRVDAADKVLIDLRNSMR